MVKNGDRKLRRVGGHIQRADRVLLPVRSVEEARILLPLAEILVQARQGRLILLPILTVPENVSLSEAASAASEFRESLSQLLTELVTITARMKVTVQTEAEVWDGIWEVVQQEQVDLLLLGWNLLPLDEVVGGRPIDTRLARPPCDVVVVHPAQDLLAAGSWRPVKGILLPVRGGRASTLSLRVGDALAQHAHASITLLHVTGPEKLSQELGYFEEFSPAVSGLPSVTRSVTVKGDVPEVIVQEARGHQAVVMGAPAGQAEARSWSGPFLNPVLVGTENTLLLVKERQPEPEKELSSVNPETVPVDRPVALVVDKWFAENTYHSREFADLERLVRLKEEQRLTLSLGLPALNEEQTVGTVIQTIKMALMDEVPLLDEIVLIDSGSEDYTRQIAADLGIPVHVHQEILPQHGAYRGKGEALWKSLYVLHGDLVGWIDTDIKNIHPRFVYGLFGPLLKSSSIQYVKGFYRRPLREGEKMLAGGGGRVTELTARPFFNLFFPELSGLVQPLSGEYAGRRAALERLPFFTGYGVETGLLIDLLHAYGLPAVAQVDLIERIHHNQPLPSLSKMSFAIMQVVFRRLEEHHGIQLLQDANRTMNLIRYGQRRRYYLEPEEILEVERPPMLTIPEYRLARGLAPEDNVPGLPPAAGSTLFNLEAR